jgi:hypothetical protein
VGGAGGGLVAPQAAQHPDVLLAGRALELVEQPTLAAARRRLQQREPELLGRDPLKLALEVLELG